MVVEGEGGGFRHPDQRDLLKLKASDTHRFPMKERLQATALYMERTREKQRQETRENIRNMTKDDKLQLSNRFARLHGGKHNATFRRVDPKRRGKTAGELHAVHN
jgi:3-phenylpropionate/cinnamic acid dioxygenase small subunit